MHRTILLFLLALALGCENPDVDPGPPPAPQNAAAFDGEVLEAITEARTAAETNPTSAIARRTLGLLYLANGGPSEASEAFRQAIVLNPQDARAWAWHAMANEKRGDVEEAIASMEQARQLAPEQRPLWWRPAFWKLEAGRPEEALRDFEYVGSLETPGRPAADGAAHRIGQARCLLELDRASEAVTILEDLQRLINHPYARYLLSQAYRRAGRGDEAERLVFGSNFDPPSYPDPWMDPVDDAKRGLDGRASRIESLLTAGRLGDASELLTEARGRWPESVPLLHLQASLHDRQGQQPARIRMLRQAVRLDPTNAASHHNLSVAMQQAGDIEAALTSAHQSVKADDTFAPGWLQAGRLTILLRGLDRGAQQNELASIQVALVPLDRAFELGVENPQDHLMYGHLLFRGARLDDAERILGRLIERPDAPPQAWAVLSELYEARGNLNAALSTAIDGANRFPGQPDLMRIINRFRNAAPSGGNP